MPDFSSQVPNDDRETGLAFVEDSLAAMAELNTTLAFGGGPVAATAKLERRGF